MKKLCYTHKHKTDEKLIDNLAQRALYGEYASGEERKKRLGKLFLLCSKQSQSNSWNR